MKEQRFKEQQALIDKLNELRQSSDVEQWQARIDKLEGRLTQLQVREYELTKNAGRQLYQARHAELARLASAPTPRLRSLGLDVLSFPKFDGSTSTQPLAVLIACRAFDASYAWLGREQALPRSSPFDRTLPVNDLDLHFERDYYWPEPELQLLQFTLRARARTPAEERLALIINGLLATNASTHQAYVNLIEGRSDIGLLARPPSADELKLAKDKGVELETAPCALDALVFLVNEKNPVRNLTTPEIRYIYSHQDSNWKSYGGRERAITAYQRDANSGSQELMRSLVMKDLTLYKPAGRNSPPRQLITTLMSGVYLQLTTDEDGIGYSVFYYERYMSGSAQTRTIAVDGVEPTYESIRRRKYPYVSDVLVVTRKGIAADLPAKRLRDWLLSPEGQAVVRESGYVPLSVAGER
jgi:phosphate transport system substrate-binding protein